MRIRVTFKKGAQNVHRVEINLALEW
jgi:hypothetical protein